MARRENPCPGTDAFETLRVAIACHLFLRRGAHDGIWEVNDDA
jgi:hypothetical protein